MDYHHSTSRTLLLEIQSFRVCQKHWYEYRCQSLIFESQIVVSQRHYFLCSDAVLSDKYHRCVFQMQGYRLYVTITVLHH